MTLMIILVYGSNYLNKVGCVIVPSSESNGDGEGTGNLIAGTPLLAGVKTSCFGCDDEDGGGGYETYRTTTTKQLSDGSLGALPIFRTKNKLDFITVPSINSASAIMASDGRTISLSSPQQTNLLVNSINQNPISLLYRSIGAPVNIIQKHIPSRGTFKQSRSQEEPHRHLHTVRKPIIQEVREIISPVRLVRQEILPVQENVLTYLPVQKGY